MKLRHFRIGILALLLITLGIYKSGLIKFPSLGDLQWKVCRLSTDASSITMSDDGNTLWFGTSDGVFEVDVDTGKEKKIATESVGSESVNSLLNDGHGGLWVGTKDGLTHLGDFNEGPEYGTSAFCLAKDGTRGLWVGQDDGLLSLEFNKKWRNLLTKDNSDLPCNTVHSLLSDGTGGVWVGMIKGLTDGPSVANLAHLKANGRLETFNLESFGAPPFRFINTLAFDKHGSLWVGTEVGLAHLDRDNTWQFHNKNNSGLPNNDITSLADDGYGGLWVGTLGGLAHLTTDNTWIVYNKDNSRLPCNKVFGIVLDNDNNPWITTYQGYVHFIPLRKNNSAKLVTNFLSFQKGTQNLKPANPQALAVNKSNAFQFLTYYNAKRLLANMMVPFMKREPPESAWFRAEKAFSLSLLTKNKYDIMVVPFQTQYGGIDHIGRSLMTYRLALEIETGTTLKVAPVNLVYQALGSRSRFFNEEDVYNLANKLGVSRIIWGYSGHRDKRNLILSLAVQSDAPFSGQSELRHKTMEPVRISSVDSPYQAFSARLGTIMDFLELPNYTAVSPKTYSTFQEPQLPASPLELFDSQQDNPIYQACYFQLLGMLTPELSEYNKNYFFIRSLIALSQASPDSPGYNLIAARAYFHLHRRPVAIDILGTPSTPAEKSFLDLLNGNLTELQQGIIRIEPSLTRLFTEIELADLKYRYHITPKPDYSTFVEQYPEWTYLLSQRITHSDLTILFSNSELKRLLEQDFPLPGFSSEELVKVAIASGDNNKLRGLYELSFFGHIKNTFEWAGDDFSFPHHNGGPDKSDYLTLLAGIGRANLLKQIEFEVYWRKDPTNALSLLDFCAGIYKDHPSFMLLKLQALYDLPNKKETASQMKIYREIYELALNGLWWSGGQDRITRIFSGYMRKLRRESKIEKRDDFIKDGFIEVVISNDYPPRTEHEPIGTIDEKLSWSHDGFGMLRDWHKVLTKEKSFSRATEFLEKYNHRFHGHPEMTGLLANLAKRKGNEEETKRLYQLAISEAPLIWSNYYLLGKLYIDEGEYDQAKDIIFNFPVFTSKEGLSNVTLSNMSYFAGNAFFSQGAYKQAKPFFEYSAALNTYSSMGLTSHARLALLQRDFKKAALYSIKRAKRYNSPEAYGEYLSYLHLIDQPDSAWAIFNERLGMNESPHIWTSALIGHRLAGIDKKHLHSWLKETAAMNKVCKQRSYPARYGFLSLIDRKPDMGMVDVINSVDDLSKYQITRGRDNIYNAMDERMGPGYLLPDKIRLERIKQNGSHPVSYYGTLAKAYLRLKQKDYQGAWDAFTERSAWYGYSDSIYGESLQSYLVWAGVKTGKEIQMSELIEWAQTTHQRQSLDKNFDLELAKAAFAGALSNHEAAVAHLKAAFTVIPQVGKRPQFPWYQIVELCEWLYEDSGQEPYRSLALTWAKKHQVIQPMFAWAYAVEAKYTQDPKAQIKALAFAEYLDKNSAHIAHFSKQEKTAAAKWMKTNGAFLNSY